MKLGEIVERETAIGPQQFIVTSRLDAGFVVLTPVPPGMTDQDLGRKFPAALVELADGVDASLRGA